MTSTERPSATEREAAAWMTRLDHAVVAQETLARFRTWREHPLNDAAFRALQTTLRQAGQLADDPQIRAALAEARQRRRRRPGPIAAGIAAACAGGAALAAAGLFVGLQSGGDTYRTLVGVRSVIHLADGSNVQLDTDSRLRVRLGPHARRLELERGQAFFDVAHDPARPFIVTAGDLQVTAVGTRFDVRRDARAHARVVLVQGQVKVRAVADHGQRAWALTAGQALATDVAPRPSPVEDDVATSWTTGRLAFHDAALSDVLTETNRYSRQHIHLAPDARLTRLRVDGVFTAGDNASLTQALRDLYGLHAAPAPDGDLVLSSPN